MQEQVLEFHKTFGHPHPESPYRRDTYRAELRLSLILEEALELAVATGCSVAVAGTKVKIFKHGTVHNVEAADAIADLLYVTIGTAIELGLDIEPFFDEVHRSNMAKLGADGQPVRRDDGKTLKPDGWTPPDLKRVMEDTYGGYAETDAF